MDNIKYNHESVWKTVKERLAVELPEHAYNTWLEPILPIALSDNELVLEVPNQFFFEWIESHYQKLIESKVRENGAGKFSVKYTIAPPDKERNDVKRAEHAKAKHERNDHLLGDMSSVVRYQFRMANCLFQMPFTQISR